MLETGKCILLEVLEPLPDLGIACLLASLKQNSIKTHLVRGSTRYLKDVLTTDSGEIVEILAQNEMSETPKCLDVTVKRLQKLIYEHGEKWFKEHLENVYKTITSRKIGDYLSIPRLKYSKELVNCVLSIYGTHIIQRRGRELSIVRKLYEEIKRSKPDIVGFSIKAQAGVFADPFFREVSQLIKSELDIPIIVGGQFTSGQPVEWINSFLTLSLKNIDYVIRGNADLSLPKLIQCIEEGKEPWNVPNVSFRSHGKIVNTNFEVIKNLDALPAPDFSQFDLDAYAAPVRILPMLTARGCPWRKCAFCSHYMSYGDYYVPLSINRVVETIKVYREKYGAHFIVFNDETLPSERAREISSALLEENVEDVYIYTYGRMDEGYTRELLELMYRAGFRVMFWGLESGCQRVLDSMNKGIKVETASRLLKDSHEVGMLNFCFIMLGFPGEERDEAMETFKFLNRHRKYVDLIALNLFTLSETSPIGRDPDKWGVVIDNSRYGYHVKKGLQPNEVEELAREMYKRVPLMVSDRFIDWWQWGVLPDPYWRYLLFIFHSRGLLDEGYVKSIIAERRSWRNLFPVFVGHLMECNSKKIVTVPFLESTPSSHTVLDDFEHTFCLLADGSRSLSMILESYKKAGNHGNEDDIARKMLKFTESLMENHLIVFFQQKAQDGSPES
jgi:radical SAM superfamily enzyme YgiQ (UPF0313 family)